MFRCLGFWGKGFRVQGSGVQVFRCFGVLVFWCFGVLVFRV